MSARVVALVVAAIATVAVPVHAHHSNLMFEMTKPVWLEGMVVSYAPVNPHTLFEIDVEVGGETQRWTVEGPFLARLKRTGAAEQPLKPGDAIQVCGFGLKQKFGMQATTAAGFDASRFVHGHVLVMPDGRLKAWGPYGKIGNCVRTADDPQRWVELLNTDAAARAAWCDRARASIPTRPELADAVATIDALVGDVCAPGVR